MWHRNRLSDSFGLQVPIVQGPFGGGHSSVALAAAVSNGGGLGSFGAVNLSSEEIRATIGELTQRTSRPFSINLWVPIPGQEKLHLPDSAFERLVQHLRPVFTELGLAVPGAEDAVAHRFEDQVEALLEARPPVFSFVMGIPDPAILDAARSRGIRTIGTATTVEEAVAQAEAGVDAVVASGSDAGGHRSSFLRPAEDSLVGTLALVPQVASAVGIPVIAAGGIVDGRGIAAALALGAEGAQLGTAFLATPESNAPPVHRALLGTHQARSTALTRVFSGRLARGIVNPLMTTLEAHLEDVLPYPAQNALTLPLRRAAAKAGRADYLALWAGQGAALARSIPAAELLRLLAEETDRVLGQERLRPRPASVASTLATVSSTRSDRG